VIVRQITIEPKAVCAIQCGRVNRRPQSAVGAEHHIRFAILHNRPVIRSRRADHNVVNAVAIHVPRRIH